MKDQMVLEDNILIKYSKSSPSGTFDLDGYIQFTFSLAIYSIVIVTQKLRSKFHDKNKIGLHLKSKT